MHSEEGVEAGNPINLQPHASVEMHSTVVVGSLVDMSHDSTHATLMNHRSTAVAKHHQQAQSSYQVVRSQVAVLVEDSCSQSTSAEIYLDLDSHQ